MYRCLPIVFCNGSVHHDGKGQRFVGDTHTHKFAAIGIGILFDSVKMSAVHPLCVCIG